MIRFSDSSGRWIYPIQLLSYTAFYLKRVPLSAQNNWVDDDGNVYVRFTVDSIARKIHKSRSVIYSALNELEAADLIKRKAGKDSRAKIIFVKIISPRWGTLPSL